MQARDGLESAGVDWSIISMDPTDFFYLPVSLQSVRGHSAIVFDGHY